MALTDDLCLTCGHPWHQGRCPHDTVHWYANGLGGVALACWCVKEAP